MVQIKLGGKKQESLQEVSESVESGSRAGKSEEGLEGRNDGGSTEKMFDCVPVDPLRRLKASGPLMLFFLPVNLLLRRLTKSTQSPHVSEHFL